MYVCMYIEIFLVSKVDKFVKYLRRVVPVLLEEEDDVPETFNKALQDRQYLENIKKFISDPQVRGEISCNREMNCCGILLYVW